MAPGFRIDKKPKEFQKKYRLFTTVIIALAAVFSLAFLILTSGSIILRFGIAILVLYVSGRIIANANSIQDSFGAYMLGGKNGIDFIGYLSKKNPKLWIAFADWGLAFSFGLASYFLFRNYVNKKTMLLGIATIIVAFLFVYPYLPVVLNFISIPQITSRISTAPSAQGVGIFFYMLLVASIIGGFSLWTALIIIYSGASILYTTILFAIGLFNSNPNYSILTQQIPGVAPLIPGLTIPLFAGLISLIILLVVHEFSHGVLAKIYKIKIKSIGVILFGVIPLGAFVEPSEADVKKLNESAQNRISIAGISANMLTSFLFFIAVFILLNYVLPNINTGGVLVTQVAKNFSAYGVIAPNSIITKWNNVPIRNQFDLQKTEAAYVPGNQVNVTTNMGVFTLTPNSSGRLGIVVAPAVTGLGYQTANFFYAIAALSFGLNFFVAIFNLLPIPGFDGWRIYQSKIKNKKLLKAIAAVVIIAILLNILPWFWTIH